MEAWKDPNTIILWMVIIIGFIAILVTSIIVMVKMNFKKILEAEQETSRLKVQYKNQLLETSVKVQERERMRIASDLHDELIGKLSALRFMNQTNSENGKKDDLLKSSIDSARRICHDLRPPLIDYTSFGELLKEKLEPWEQKFDIEFIRDERIDVLLLSDLKIHMLRIFQEILNNIVKHSGAKRILIHYRLTQNWLALKISDNGKGYNKSEKGKGLGLQNIELRMQYVKGNYKIKSQQGKGVSFLFFVPTVYNEDE